MKNAFGTVVAVVVLAGVAWGGGYLYWHIRLLGAIRTLETRSTPQGSDADAVEIVEDAGCKSLPYLISAMQPSKNPYFLFVASDLLKKSLKGPISRGDPDVTAHLQEWLITPETRAEDRQKRCDDLHQWWREKGEPRHSGGKWWKSDCGGI